MPKAEIFTVKDDIQLQFESKGKPYFMKLNISSGLILLYNIEGKELVHNFTHIIGEPVEHTEVQHEVVSKPVDESLEQISITNTPKKKKGEKK